MTARLLFAAKRVSPGIQVAVAYLCTRVRESTMDDYVNLTRVMKYLRATINLLGWDETGTLLCSINPLYTVHNDM